MLEHMINQIPPGYSWLIRWDEKEKHFFIHIYSPEWNTNSSSWDESYKATASTAAFALALALTKLSEAKEQSE